MKHSRFKSTTSLVMIAGMVMGQTGGAFAQGAAELTLTPELQAIVGAPDAPRIDGELQICALEDPVPCVLPNGEIAEVGEEGLAAQAAEDEEAVAMAEILAESDASVGVEVAPADEAQAPEAAEEPAAEEPAAEAEPAEEPASEPEMTEAPAEEPAAEPEATEPEVTEAPAEEPAAEAEADAEAAVEPAPEVAPEAEAEAEADAEVAPAEEPADTAATEEPAAEGSDESLADALKGQLENAEEGAKEAVEDATDAVDDATKAVEEAVTDTAEEPAGETTVATDDAGLTEEAAAREAEAAAAEQAAAQDVAAAAVEGETGDAAMADGEVVQETVSADDVRSSDEDFSKTAAADAEAKAKADDNKGLSDIEKIALLGIGALVVGAILKNGDEVVSTSGDRAVVQRDDGSVYIVKNDDEILRQPGSNIETRRFEDGSTLTIVKRENGTEVRTIRDATGRVLRRTKVLADGTSVQLFDDTQVVEQVDVSTLPKAQAPEIEMSNGDLEAALRSELDSSVDRRFSLGQVRNIRAVRELVPIIELDTITFDTGSAAIRGSEAEELVGLGQAMQSLLAENPGEVFLIEGHTDAVGSATSNLTLSDRRAESLALALTEYFDIPPENMVVQGYGEAYLKVPTLDGERANRRVAVRRITPLLTASAGGGTSKG